MEQNIQNAIDAKCLLLNVLEEFCRQEISCRELFVKSFQFQSDVKSIEFLDACFELRLNKNLPNRVDYYLECKQGKIMPSLKTSVGNYILAMYEDDANELYIAESKNGDEFKVYWRNHETKKSHSRYKIKNRERAFKIFNDAIKKIQAEKC